MRCGSVIAGLLAAAQFFPLGTIPRSTGFLLSSSGFSPVSTGCCLRLMSSIPC